MNDNIFYSSEIDAYQTGNMTLSAKIDFNYANAKKDFDKEKHFYKVFDEHTDKIKLDINNFKNGKGDAAKHYSFNLDVYHYRSINKWFYYKEYRQKKFYLTKSYDSYPEKDGKYAGMHKVLSLSIEYIELDKDGKPMNYPFKIQIWNGYGKEGEQKASVDNYYGVCQMNELSFQKFIDDIQDAIDVFKMEYAMSGILQRGREGLAKQNKEISERKKAAESANKTSQTTQNNVQQTQPVQQYTSQPPVQQNVVHQNAVQNTVQSTANTQFKKEIHTIEGRFVSDFQHLSDRVVVNFENEKGVFPITFKEVPDVLKLAQELGRPVTINIYQYGKSFIFDSLI